jgi:uncharacterized membrane protein YeaQ/YmgE (transglycosylase-associated protein family)
MAFLTWIILGLVAGWLASVVMKTNSTQGFFMDIVLGIAGAFLGGFVMNLLGQEGVNGLNFYSVAVATVGAILLIWIGRMFTTRELNP